MEKYGKIAGLDKPCSRLFFGCAIKPMNAGENTDYLLDKAFCAGINAYDTARVYGKSEFSLGHWIKARGNRDKIVLLTKGGHPDMEFGNDGAPIFRRRISRKEIRADIETSLLALGVDDADIYLLHRDDKDVDAGEIATWLDELVKEGKARTVGVSNWTYERIDEARKYAFSHNLTPITVSSPHFSLARLDTDLYGDGCVTLTGGKNADARKWYRENKVSVISYASLSQGFFSGRWTSADFLLRENFMDKRTIEAFGSEDNFHALYRAEKLAAEKGCTVSQLALRWCFSRGLNLFAAVGSTKGERMLENWNALDISLTPEESDWLCGK